MANETPSNYDERLTTLEGQVKVLARALAEEKEKTAGLEAAVVAYQQGLDQTLDSYEKAFGQAAKSYETIIQRALTLSGRPAAVGEGQEGAPPMVDEMEESKRSSMMDSVVSIVDDLPKVLASAAIVISLITGGTSIISLVKSNSAQSTAGEAQIKAETAQDTSTTALDAAGSAKLDATEAKKDAETAKGTSETALDTAGSAKLDATEAKKDAETAKSTSGIAVEVAATAQADATDAKNEASNANQKADTALDAASEGQGQ